LVVAGFSGTVKKRGIPNGDLLSYIYFKVQAHNSYLFPFRGRAIYFLWLQFEVELKLTSMFPEIDCDGLSAIIDYYLLY